MVAGDGGHEPLLGHEVGGEPVRQRVDRGDHREVELAAEDGGGEAVGRRLGQRQPDRRVRAVEAGQQVGQPRRRARADDADRDLPAEQPGALLDGAADGGDGGERRAGVRQHGGAGVGRPHRAARAVQQRLPQLGLEPAHLGAHAGLRDVQPLGRTREARLLGDRDEILELAELHNGSC